MLSGLEFYSVTPKWVSTDYLVDFLHWNYAKVSARPPKVAPAFNKDLVL